MERCPAAALTFTRRRRAAPDSWSLRCAFRNAKVHAIFESNREVRWYVGEERTEYADGVQRRLESAYQKMQSGSGPQYPTEAVEGGEVSLRKMQEISATGVTRPVIRE